jgi:hypothetical protein
VPRTIAGVPNGFRIRRLKDKLGTRGLASAEIDFDNALAWPIGEIDEGFKVAVGELLNTSRWLNAIGSTGLMRRAVIEASSFARHRTAFGRPIGSFPLVREQLALMKVEEQAALASTMLLTRLVEAVDTGVASDAERASHRFLVNANKYVTSIGASDVVHGAIEALGGNGTIEDFSPLPRLYRDAIVYESWEGTHNVLCAQVQRDCARLELLDPVVESIHAELARAGHASGDDVKVVGIFDVGMYEYDAGLALINLRDGQALYHMGRQVTGVRLKLTHVEQAPQIRRALAAELPPYYQVRDWSQEHANFFRALKTEKTVMFVILLLIVAVAAFNIVATLVMVVTDKRADIAILRTLGSSPSSILVIFLVQGTLIGVVGTFVGVVLGVVLSLNVTTIVPFVEHVFHTHFLSANVYYISELPSHLRWIDVVHVALASFAMSFAATLYPAWRAAKTEPAEALRYE